MPALLTCALGHQWDGEPSAPTPCPQCGGRPLRPDERRLLDDMTTRPPPVTPPVSSLPAEVREWPAVPGYQIFGEIARGGMGIVYRARQPPPLSREVALKMILAGTHADAEQLARFRIEAEAVARLNHPHVVRIHDFGEFEGRPYFSMEFVAGGNLASYFASGPLPVAQAAELVEVLARAIHHAHQQHLIHRDLKPANVLLAHRPDSAGDLAGFPYVPKIADFGLAKRLDHRTDLSGSRLVMGTASYMAPEQVVGRIDAIGPAADTYALGAILYEALTGRPPFRAATREATHIQVLAAEPERPTHLRAEVPRDLEEICLKCLEKEAGQRYSSALALADDLHRFQAGEALAIAPLSDWEREIRWARPAGFEVLELIGCTTLGMVYKARQRSLNRLVTLATISSRARTDPDQLARFRAEAEVAAHLEHPNIVQIYDLGEHNGQPYLSLEHLDGGTLSEQCANRPLSAAQAAQLIELLARATHHAHQRGIVHTDLRPFNVQLKAPHPGTSAEQGRDDDLTRWFGTPKITGFGLARLLEKPHVVARGWAWRRAFSNYMAPEQVAGTPDAIGPATDIHALGAMLYELLAGQPPYLSDTIDETLRRIHAETPRPPSEVRDGVSRRLESICLKCLQKDPAQRYPSAEELARDLHRYWAGNEPPTDEFELVPGYELLEELGPGGIGVVYKARQISLDRMVALKIFRRRLDHILAASRAVSRLSHPNLVQVHDCGERDGVLFVAEEFVEGGSLEGQIAGRPQPPRQAAQTVETLARAMHYVHDHGIIHRNLKPSVVLLTDLDIPKISSFDLARLIRQGPGAEEQSGLLGTPAYMAPEQAGGRTEEIGPATDIYALGEILYEMLTGRRLFEADGVADMLKCVLSEEPVPPRRLRAEVPPALEAICLRCLRKAPAERYPSAATLAEALAEFREYPVLS